MMSKISDIFNSVVTRLDNLLSPYDYVQMPDAYSIVSNANLDLRKGWSLGIGPTSPSGTQEGFCSRYLFDTVYFVTLVNDYNMRLDTNARNDDEKSISEDMFLVIQDLLKNYRLGGESVDISFVDESGPQYLDKEQKRYLVNVGGFRIRYQENLT